MRKATWQEKPLYAPESLPVKEDSNSNPVSVGNGKRTIKTISDRWRIDDEWWRQEPISRMYYCVVLDNGLHLIVYKDLLTGQWYQQKIGTTK